MNDYLIPHNFKNNGRIMNMFTKKGAIKAGVCVLILMIIISIIKTTLFIKAMIFISVGFPICLLALLEIDTFMLNVLNFYKNRKVYYRYFEKRGEANVKYRTFYEKEKNRKRDR